jgi:type III restriction enzyme
MTDLFFQRPIINSPYDYPGQHWQLDADGQPTNQIRRSKMITPIPKPKKRKTKNSAKQQEMVFFVRHAYIR